MNDESLDEQRAIDIAQADLRSRVSWSADASMTIASDHDGYTVSFLRPVKAGEPMIRGGGIDAGVTYRLSRAHEIEAITYPR